MTDKDRQNPRQHAAPHLSLSEEFGVQSPMSFLWHKLEEALPPAALEQIAREFAIVRKKYSRASRLRWMRRHYQTKERTLGQLDEGHYKQKRRAQFDRMERALANPEAYINGEGEWAADFANDKEETADGD